MKTLKTFLKNEFISGKSISDWVMLSIGILLQIIAIIYGGLTNNLEHIGLIVSNLTGVIFVILCAQGKITSFAFHIIHIVTYIIFFVIPNSLWGELIENCMYILTDIVGTFTWFKRYKWSSNNTKVKAKNLGVKRNIIVAMLFVIGVLVHYVFLLKVPMFGRLDSQPLLDSITSIPAYIGQLLLVLGYSEQWIYWFILDFSSIFLAARAGSIIMSVQFTFWSINTIYGFISWYKNSREVA